MNNVDLATQKLRELQTKIYDYNVSPNDLFKITNDIMPFMDRASQEIQTNYKTISEKLTKQMNTGRVQE
tara:strand:- start:1234 stop:1440 length:207 start_codon:yes stop_codon:yes gene_type:complete